jgi:hypothetical protein
MYVSVFVRMHVYTYVYVYAYVYTYMSVRVHACTYVCIHVCIYTYIQYVCTYTHTYVHVRLQLCEMTCARRSSLCWGMHVSMFGLHGCMRASVREDLHNALLALLGSLKTTFPDESSSHSTYAGL